MKIEAEKVNDALRYTMILPEAKYFKEPVEIQLSLKKQGFEATAKWDAWNNPSYRGINYTFKDKQGQLFELQFHTKESFDVKSRLHKLYEESRLQTTLPERKKELNDEMEKQWLKVSRPSGIKGIADWI